MDRVLIITLAALLGGGSAVVGLLVWRAARCQQRIRRWADEHGYGIISLDYRRPLGGFASPIIGGGSWHVVVEDAEGGQRAGWVSFGNWFFDLPWGKMQIRWE